MKKIFIILLLLGLSSYAEGLRPTKSSMSLGGSLSFPLESDFANKTSLGVDASPSFSYFLLDGFETSIEAKFKTKHFFNAPAMGESNERFLWGLSLGMKYLFDFSWPFYPFVGGSIGYEMAGSDLSTIRANVSLPIGIYLPLKKDLFLIFAIKTKASFFTDIRVFDKLSFEPGYFGIQAIF